jgi:hypothetical protein
MLLILGNEELFISALMVAEARSGDAQAAGRRLDFPEGLPLLSLNDAAEGLPGDRSHAGAQGRWVKVKVKVKKTTATLL